MYNLLRRIYNLLTTFGIDPRTTICSIQGLPAYFRDLRQLKRQKKTALHDFPFGMPHPCFVNRSGDSGSIKDHYFHQDLLVARRIHLNAPTRHVDVGSRIDGFVAHVAAFRNIEVIDIRTLPNNIPNVTFMQSDFMMPLQEDLFEYSDSISCLHAIEHFGLGRYGDPVNYDGYIQGFKNLYNMLQKGGKLYFSVPIGPQRIEFNAHRVFSTRYLFDCFADKYIIDEFSLIDDQGKLHENISICDDEVQNNFGCTYGCGIFELTKQ